MKIEWTQDKKNKVCQKIENWIIEHGSSATSGEGIAQDDDCQIDAPNLIGDLVDDIIKPEVEDED